MAGTHRWVAVLMAAILLVVDVSITDAQAPPARGKGDPAARGKAAEKGKARRRPRRKAPPGVIVPYPFPPALIIRQTPEAHDEVRALLNLLRYQ